MKRIASDLYTFTGLLLGRVYLITDPDGLTIVDASLPHAPYQIIRQLRAIGREPAEVRRILVTHAHPDHIGGLRKLQELTGAQVISSAQERPVIEGRMPIARRSLREARGLSRLSPRPPRVLLRGVPVARALRDGDFLPDVMGGLQAVATPGHTPGHMSFWQPQRRILFCGDVIAAGLWLRLPSPTWTFDMVENRRSIRLIAALDAEIVCFGHGNPLKRRAALTLREFAQRVALKRET